MRDRARVCVATIAFGLGIDKANVSAVVHTCLPGSFEHYTQEVGRAGRSGAPAIARAIITQADAVTQVSVRATRAQTRTGSMMTYKTSSC
jgi:superfamily II DNA helicase RecQ